MRSAKPFFVREYIRFVRACMVSLDIHPPMSFLLAIQDRFLKLNGIAVTDRDVKARIAEGSLLPSGDGEKRRGRKFCDDIAVQLESTAYKVEFIEGDQLAEVNWASGRHVLSYTSSSIIW